MGGAFDVSNIHSDAHTVTIEASPSLFNHLEVTRRGETLKLGYKWHFLDWRPRTSRPKASVGLPLLRELSLHGASRGSISGFESGEDLLLKLSGASRLSGDAGAGNVRSDVSGASRVELAGAAMTLTLEANGASRVDLADFAVQTADVQLSGASQVSLNVEGRLNATLSGASRIAYSGQPIMGDIKLSGASSLRRA